MCWAGMGNALLNDCFIDYRVRTHKSAGEWIDCASEFSAAWRWPMQFEGLLAFR
jgi:hypothetical protein